MIYVVGIAHIVLNASSNTNGALVFIFSHSAEVQTIVGHVFQIRIQCQ